MANESNMKVDDVHTSVRARYYAAELYKFMDDAATTKTIGEGDQEQTVRVWQGYLTQATKSVGIPDGVYRRVTKLLEDTGCIQLVSRGARGYESVVLLLDAPTEERLANPSVLTKRADSATLTLRVQEFLDQIGGLNIAEALVNIEGRLQALEAKMSKLGKK